MDGWTEDLRGGLGHRSSPCVPALWVEWTKCLLTGTNTQLFDDLPLGQAHTDTFNILFDTAISSFSLKYRKKKVEKRGRTRRDQMAPSDLKDRQSQILVPL